MRFKKKLSNKYTKSFEIENVVDTQTYRLKLSFKWRIHSIFHVFFLEKISYQWFHKIVCKSDFVKRSRKMKNKKDFRREKKDVSIFDSLKKIFIFEWRMNLKKKIRKRRRNVDDVQTWTCRKSFVIFTKKEKTIVKTKF